MLGVALSRGRRSGGVLGLLVLRYAELDSVISTGSLQSAFDVNVPGAKAARALDDATQQAQDAPNQLEYAVDLIPRVGFDSIELGEDRDALVARIGGTSKQVRSRIMCFGAGVFLDADDAGRVKFIEFFDRDVPLSFRDLDLWDARSVRALIGLGFAASFDPGESGVTFHELGLAYYLEDGQVASVSAFPDGYYDGIGLARPTVVHTADDIPAWLSAAIERHHG